MYKSIELGTMSDDPYFQADMEEEGEGESGNFYADADDESSYTDLGCTGLRGPLRKGKWTVEEETYANRIIHYFNEGSLGIPPRTTLRSYLSEKLNWCAFFLLLLFVCSHYSFHR